MSLYQDRVQTETKHFILRRYLQKLAYKTAFGGFPILAYIDGFSGPWQTKSTDHSDSSFMIAISVLKEVQKQARDAGKSIDIRCFFVESGKAYSELKEAVMPHHDPANGFSIETFNGRFEDAMPQIERVMKDAFALTFIDPTGWTGYAFDKIGTILQHQKGEVLINFMYDFINRFTASTDPKILRSFDGILGSNWETALVGASNREEALRGLFAAQFRAASGFKYVLDTAIEKISDRTHFCIVYGTRSSKGLEAYRDVEIAALTDHDHRRLDARQKQAEDRTGQTDMFPALLGASEVTKTVQGQRAAAKEWILEVLARRGSAIKFGVLWPKILERFMLRLTDAKQICGELGKENRIEKTWASNGSRRRIPSDGDDIVLVVS